MKKLLVAAGGTGGHIFPAMAVANLAKADGVDVLWVGCPDRMEAKLVPAQFPIEYINIKAMRGKGLRVKLMAPWRLLHATFQALCVLRRFKPDCVLSMGGFVSAPVGVAAKLLRLPLVIHEQNAIAGMTNRYLAKVANRVYSAFASAFAKKVPAHVVGNPVRTELYHVANSDHEERLHLLVLGGSQGARFINQVVANVFSTSDLSEKVSVWHQVGQYDIGWVREKTKNIPHYRSDVFIKDMAKAYGFADVVLCRAGALTISELAAVGLASILVPFPGAVDDHQSANARALSDQKAAWLIAQCELTEEALESRLRSICDNKAQLKAMGEKAKSVAHPNAAMDVYKGCCDVGSK